MLSRLLTVRLKTAERALKDGRIDDAFRLATEPDIRQHRRGADVLHKLTDRFLARAREHFKADRYAEALIDLTKAEAGGVHKTEIAELREQVRVVAEEELRKENSRRLRLEAAKRRIERGSLQGGERILEQVSVPGPEVQALRSEVDNRQQDASEALADVEKLFGQGQIAASLQRLERARSAAPNSVRLAELEGKIAAEVLRRARASVDTGRIRRAADELALLQSVHARQTEQNELRQIIDQAGQAGRALTDNRFDQVLQDVMRLQHLAPKTDWIKKTVGQLRQLDELLLALRSGPLGECSSVGGAVVPVADSAAAKPGASLEETVALPARAPAGTLPTSLLLLVDGGGSFLLHRGDRVSLGRAASSRPADIPILSDLSERHAEIARVEDDYFLFASQQVEIGGRAARHQLLRDGDRVTLGRRAKLSFRMPNRRSTSAVLEMSDSTRMPNDVRRVVLLRKTATIGFGRSVHISCGNATRELLLFERAGRLWVQPLNQEAQSEATEIVLGKPLEMCGLSFVVEPWQMRDSRQRNV